MSHLFLIFIYCEQSLSALRALAKTPAQFYKYLVHTILYLCYFQPVAHTINSINIKQGEVSLIKIGQRDRAVGQVSQSQVRVEIVYQVGVVNGALSGERVFNLQSLEKQLGTYFCRIFIPKFFLNNDFYKLFSIYGKSFFFLSLVIYGNRRCATHQHRLSHFGIEHLLLL